ncbi:MAG: alpha-E domain-containing protein [Coriobacteriales bacterium]|jgi:uncharacterized alpha-E superfamily protein|nr:alpha-E domain-containing protein [Coriobacteriales bacterium]
MLSRIAESLFWIGRYLQRSEYTARILDTHIQLVNEAPDMDTNEVLQALMHVMDQPVTVNDGEVSVEAILGTLAYDAFNPSSTDGALLAARENARRAREVISTELWETLNTTRLTIEAINQQPYRSAHEHFVWIRERVAMAKGIIDSATSRDDSWNFLVLGMAIESADMTARLVLTQTELGERGPSWVTLLRSCNAYEAYIRAVGGLGDDRQIAAFLLRDQLFPRSILSSLSTCDEMLISLEGQQSSLYSRTIALSDARNALGSARALLAFTEFDELLAQLPEFMEQVERACSKASDAIRVRYFPTGSLAEWMGETL